MTDWQFVDLVRQLRALQTQRTLVREDIQRLRQLEAQVDRALAEREGQQPRLFE